MSKVDTWIPFHVAEYVADTMRFTAEQHGCYLLLILDYWRSGAPPDDDDVLAQIVKMPVSKWRKLRPVLEAKFQVTGGVWKHKRIEHEISKAQVLQQASSDKGKKGAAARWHKDSNGHASGNGTGIEQAKPGDMPGDAPLPSSLPSSLPTSLPQPDSLPQPSPTPVPAGLLPTPTRRANGEAKEAKSAAVWAAYSVAYRERYKVEPVRNAKCNANLAHLVDRVGAADAPLVAAFYLKSNKAFYLTRKHPTDLLEKDAEALRTEWAVGRAGTETEARQADRTQATGNVFGKLIEEARNGSE